MLGRPAGNVLPSVPDQEYFPQLESLDIQARRFYNGLIRIFSQKEIARYDQILNNDSSAVRKSYGPAVESSFAVE
jgi:hypothetical protein